MLGAVPAKTRNPMFSIMSSVRHLVVLVLVFGAMAGAFAEPSAVFKSQKASFRIVTLISGLNHPWSVAFLPSGDILVTERPGTLRMIQNSVLLDSPITGLPPVSAKNDQGGLLDIALDPDFANNHRLCLSYVARGEDGRGTEIACGELRGNHLHNVEVIFKALPKSGTGRHFGSRLLFASDGYLYATLGERGYRPQAQNRATHPGSLVRIARDGSIPPDNPFVGDPASRPEIYTYGNRNPQGLAEHPTTRELWMHEHGPRGGDELNRVIAGANYGWPVISYGKEYFLPKAVGEGTHKEGMRQPVYYWDPSIAPSGMTFYTGPDFPGWAGDLFIGSLKFGELVRLELEDGQVINEERLLNRAFGRIRDVRQGPDGALYLLTDERNGRLLKVIPQD